MLDEAHIQQTLASDPGAAASEAIRALGPAILRYLRALLRNESDAADAFSAWAETLWKSLPGFRREAALRTWAYRIAWSCARGLQDEAWRRRGRPLETGEASQLAAEVRTSSALIHEQKRQALDELRAELSQEDQSLLVLRIDQELSWSEIAHVLAAEGAAVEPAALMKRFERLKGRLAKLAKERGLLR